MRGFTVVIRSEPLHHGSENELHLNRFSRVIIRQMQHCNIAISESQEDLGICNVVTIFANVIVCMSVGLSWQGRELLRNPRNAMAQ